MDVGEDERVTKYAAEPLRPDRSVAGSVGFRDARTLRPGSSVAIGVFAGLGGLALLVPAVVSSPRSWGIIAGIVLGLVFLWLFLVRPSATIHAEGVRLANPLRNVDVTWPAIDEVRSKWALELVCAGRKYTAWAIPADPGRPKHGHGIFGIGSSKVGFDTAPAEPANRFKVDAQAVAAEIAGRVAEDRRRTDGTTPTVAHRVWDPVSVSLLVGSFAFFVIAVFVG